MTSEGRGELSGNLLTATRSQPLGLAFQILGAFYSLPSVPTAFQRAVVASPTSILRPVLRFLAPFGSRLSAKANGSTFLLLVFFYSNCQSQTFR
ncbi:hypothetical protein KQX54_020959 [Cotesia glomerata]|uniref:Uncharacterized protein n=1 Tax=Cotesia glomerata TaxID=32391 RepID=A0AAV7I2G8_COTGL|nr:hypothetical protein KQX54_020959 [Cotesia glomerata]